MIILLLDFSYTLVEAESMRAYFLTVYLVLGLMLMARAQALIENQSASDQVRLLVLKGHLMMLVGRYEIARRLYEMALSILPVQHTGAVPALANVITLTCDKKALGFLQENYPRSDLSRYWSKMVGCD